jgi:hypothetical protein
MGLVAIFWRVLLQLVEILCNLSWSSEHFVKGVQCLKKLWFQWNCLNFLVVVPSVVASSKNFNAIHQSFVNIYQNFKGSLQQNHVL